MDLIQIREEAQSSSTEVLLDQVTVYRGEMEGPAVDIAETELSARGVSGADVDAHAAMRARARLSRHPDGTIVRCTYCPRPAIEHQWRWHRLWGWFLPLWPRFFHLCEKHVENPPTDPYGRPLHYDRKQ
ncbi:MAG: hypothetical protein U0793_08065 [Gemmataceae bacterium]